VAIIEKFNTLREEVSKLTARSKKSENILVMNLEKIMYLITDANMPNKDKAKELELILTSERDEFNLFKGNDTNINTSSKKKNNNV